MITSPFDFLYRSHLQRYVLWCNSFIRQNYIDIKKCKESLITWHNLPECTCIISWTYSQNLILDQIFIPLVLRGHGCHIVLFYTLTQVIREWHVFGRFIKWYPGSNDMLWVILQCNIPASLPMINSIICAAYSYVLVIPNPNIKFVENIILL